jgi:hypothetical protein
MRTNKRHHHQGQAENWGKVLVAFAGPMTPAAALHVTMYYALRTRLFLEGDPGREKKEFIDNQQVTESW